MTAPPPGLWRTILLALRGARGQDFTQGPIGRALLLLAVPMVLEVALESVFAVVNAFWVNRLGASAVATIGLTEAMISSIFALAMGLGIAATATVARRIGEKNPEGASVVAVQAVMLGVLVSIPIAVFGGIFAPQLLTAMGASADVIAEGAAYTRIMFVGNGAILLLFMINAIFRGAGDAAVAMHCLWLANLCNLVLDPLLIFGLGPFPKLGVAGAAVATTVGRGIGVAFQVYRLLRRDRRFVIERRHLRLHWPVMLNLARMARNSIFQIMVATISWTAIVRIVALFGDFAVAGYTSAIRVFLFALLPAWGLSNAAATMVGQSLGARDPARAAAAVWKAGFFNMLCLGSVGIVFQFTAPTIARIFTDNDEVAHHLVVALRIISAGYPFYAYGMVFSNGFNGAGDSRTPTILNLFCFWLWEIPLAWLLAVPLGLGVPGVCAAIAVAFSTLAIAGGVMFRRGHWQTKKV